MAADATAVCPKCATIFTLYTAALRYSSCERCRVQLVPAKKLTQLEIFNV